MAKSFDPDKHTVAEVQAHLDGADADEFTRVVEAEAGGQARKGILGYAQDPETAQVEPDEDGYTRIVVSS